MKIVRFAAAMVLLAAPAYAQVSGSGGTQPEKSLQQIQSEQNAERAYKKSLSNIPDKGPVDPWGSMRNDSAPSVANVPSAKRAKGRSTGN